MTEHINEAMSEPSFSCTPRLGASRIGELRAIIDEACIGLEALGIPDSLLHGDIHYGNILAGPLGCVFTDWAQAAVGNPFITFEQLRTQVAQDRDTAHWVGPLTESYRQSWREVLTEDQIKCALSLVPPVAILSYVFDQWERLASEDRHDPQFQSYLRAMTRQIDRAARAIDTKAILCA
jgi:hypothetical protein